MYKEFCPSKITYVFYIPFNSAILLLGIYPPGIPQGLHWLNTSSSVCLCFLYTVSRILLLLLPKCLLFSFFSVPAQTLPRRVWPSSLSPCLLTSLDFNPPSTYQLKDINSLHKIIYCLWRIKGYYQKCEKTTHRMRENICKPHIWQAINIAYRQHCLDSICNCIWNS